MAQAPATSWSCTRFSDRGGTYFVSVAQHAGLADGDVDLAVTDGGAAWTATGAPVALWAWLLFLLPRQSAQQPLIACPPP